MLSDNRINPTIPPPPPLPSEIILLNEMTLFTFLLCREIPQELLRLSRRGEVHVNMEDHRHEDYIPPPKPKIQAFTGAGHKLGRLVSCNQLSLLLVKPGFHM